jgi:tetratricopeptide (TPR) repeat protein
MARRDDAWARTPFRSLAGGALVLTSVAAFPPAHAITVEEFSRSAAAAAYSAGRYDAALAEVGRMLAREPRDPILLRVRGMALYRLGRFEEAETALTAAVIAAPGDPAAHYWLGATRHKRGNLRGALVEFEMVERLAPNTRYSASAREFSAAIRTQAATPGAPPAAPQRPWALSITTGMQYDDNIALLNRDRVEGFRFFGEALGQYVFQLPNNFALSLDGRVFGSAHPRAAANDFDLFIVSGGPTLSWRTNIGALPARLSLGYAYEYVMQGTQFFSNTHSITPKIEIGFIPDSVTSFGFTFGIDGFALQGGLDPTVFARDGMHYTATFRHVHYLPGRRHYVWAGYEFTQYDTDGANFDAYAHAGSVGASVALPWDLRLDLGAELGYTRYFNYVDSPKRRALKQTYTAWLTKQVTANLSVSVAYAYTFDDSNIRDLETRRNLFTVNARYSF